MKKRFPPPVLVVITLAVLIAVAGCSNTKDHVHSYVLDDSKWVSDESGHWHVLKCVCGDEKKVDTASHAFGEKTETDGTCRAPGTKSESCTICGYTKEEKIKNHNFNEETAKCTLCDGYKCGDNVAAVYDPSTKTLTVSGTGDMDDEYTYSIPNSSKSPWKGNDITSVVIEDGVTSVSKYAFSQEGITDVVLGKDIREIKDGAFSGTGITSIVFPDNLKTLGTFSFEGTKITELNIPAKVDVLTSGAFWYINSLTTINIHPDNESAVSIDGVVYSKDKSTLIAVSQTKTDYTIPEGTKIIRDLALLYWQGTELEIPASVTEISDSAFAFSQIAKITFKEGLKSIGGYAFYNCNIEKAELPSTIEEIGERAFGNSKLKEITIGNSIKSIGTGAFYGCKDITITIDKNSSFKSSLDTENNNWGATNATVKWTE